MEGRGRAQTRAQVITITSGQRRTRTDLIAVEEPLEIRLRAGNASERVAVTMRTPGNDFELAAGFLFAEGLIVDRNDLATIGYCLDRDLTEEQRYNVVTVDLRASQLPPVPGADRRFPVSSACGVCGKTHLDQIERQGLTRITAPTTVSPEILAALPDRLREAQGVFERTGGLHAAGLFTAEGELIALREDVGRHNAVDKLIGWALLEGMLPLSGQIVLVSGRTSFEITQKCAAAGVPILAAVSAPSSLAIDLATRFGMTLIGFLRGEQFNVYAGGWRVGDVHPGLKTPG
jgi:FdhD protein